MMHCLNTGNSEKSEMSVLERQHFRLKLQQQLPVTCYLNENEEELGGPFLGDQGLSELVNGSMKPDFRRFLSSEFEMNYALPSCPAAEVMTPGERETSKKRKADKTHKEEKKMKGCAEEESTTTSATTGSSNTKKNAKDTCAPKTDYIHVRARRGQATDSHSLAERVRREKISERMKYLQDLVPGCNKITGKAGMLDEIINYVQSLQRQVEFLSMKLAAINPRLDFDVENYLLKEIMGASSSDQFNLQFNSTSALGGVVMVGNDPMAMDMQQQQLRRTTSAPITIPHAFLDSSNLSQIQPIAWEDELQSFYNMEYQQGRSTPFIPQPFTGFQEQGHVKLEM